MQNAAGECKGCAVACRGARPIEPIGESTRAPGSPERRTRRRRTRLLERGNATRMSFLRPRTKIAVLVSPVAAQELDVMSAHVRLESRSSRSGHNRAATGARAAHLPQQTPRSARDPARRKRKLAGSPLRPRCGGARSAAGCGCASRWRGRATLCGRGDPERGADGAAQSSAPIQVVVRSIGLALDADADKACGGQCLRM
jgi:hypothetical protein